MQFELVNGEVKDVERMPTNVSFYEHAKKVGVGKFIPVDYVQIKAVGQRDYMSRPATEDDKAAYPNEWAAYQSGLSVENEGLNPLTMLPGFKKAFGLELAKLGIHTVEELAAQPEAPFDYLAPLYAKAKALVMSLELLESEDESRAAS